MKYTKSPKDGIPRLKRYSGQQEREGAIKRAHSFFFPPSFRQTIPFYSIMGLSSQISKFIKKSFIPKDEEQPTESIYSADSRPTSRPGSIMNGFSRDPMRCGTTPDVVGHYYDPMGTKYSPLHGIDPTNTGA